MAELERYAAFINSMDTEHPEHLESLYKRARADKIPVIRRETQSFLRTLVRLLKPQHILEIGSGIGFSAILMAHYAPNGCAVTTVEIDEKRAAVARENIEALGFAGRINLIEEDAANALPKLNGAYDLIFMDAAKGQYLGFLPEVKRLLKSGGALVSDNIFQNGDILESRFMVERRDRTIHKRMREYIYALKHDEALYTSLLPLGDGVALSVKL